MTGDMLAGVVAEDCCLLLLPLPLAMAEVAIAAAEADALLGRKGKG